MAKITSFSVVGNPTPGVLIWRCSDPRLGIAQCDWATSEMGWVQGDFVSICIGGGPAALAHREEKVQDFRFILNQTMFFLGHCPTIERIVLIGHQDCGYYKTIKNPGKKDQEKNDLPVAVTALQRELRDAHTWVNSPKLVARIPSISVEAHFISFTDARRNEVSFEKVA